MRRGLLLLFASLLLFVSVPVIAAAATTTGSGDILSTVSLRNAPSTSGGLLKYLKAGETVSILDEPNSYWFKVKDSNGVIGYISSNDKYVSIKTQAGLAGANAIVVGSVSFRTAPSTSGDRIRYLQVNEQMIITEKVNSYWYAIKDSSGVSGYVSSSEQYVKLTAALPQPPAPTVPTATEQVELIIAAGNKYLGTPYEFGSDRSNTATFDCSDFVRQAFKDALNVLLPASSSQQGAYVRGKNAVTTDWQALKRGDLMFFMDYKGTSQSSYSGKSPFSEDISHVGIYLGNGQVLHTYSVASGGVRMSSIVGKHWEYRFLYGGSAL